MRYFVPRPCHALLLLRLTKLVCGIGVGTPIQQESNAALVGTATGVVKSPHPGVPERLDLSTFIQEVRGYIFVSAPVTIAATIVGSDIGTRRKRGDDGQGGRGTEGTGATYACTILKIGRACVVWLSIAEKVCDFFA